MCNRDKCSFAGCPNPSEPIRVNHGDRIGEVSSWHDRPELNCYHEYSKFQLADAERRRTMNPFALA
jgi:uncharacterized protein YqiB (DUF1249 family)